MDNYYSDFKVNKEYLPEAICIDELKSVKNIEGAISFIFRDYQRKSIIDIVKGSKDKVDYLLEKSPELETNFNVYQDIIQAIRHNNFKRFENIVKKYLTTKEKISKKMMIALKTLKKYMKYIENMFESNITNGLIDGLIEGLNNKIKSIKRTAFGYSDFSNFKKCILIEAGIISISA